MPTELFWKLSGFQCSSLPSDSHRIVYVAMVLATEKYGVCAGWIECSSVLKASGISYNAWRKIVKELVRVGLVSESCEILP